jgi:hypothetical protein
MQVTENQKSIALWREGRRKLFDFVTNALKRAIAAKQQKSAAVALFEDDFVAETGVDIATPEGKQALADAKVLHIRRAEQKREQREWREMQGPLAEFDDLDGPMGGLPSDSDLEAEILKQHPEMRKYR